MSDGDRLASVTWLFGQPEEHPTTEPTRSPSVVPASPGAAAPEFTAREVQSESSAPPGERHSRASRPSRAGEFERINNVSMHALARRGMSVAEMRDYLIGRDFDKHEADDECERLLGVGLLDDFALAETLIRTLRQRKGLGRSGVTAELRRRKLENEAIEAALEDLDDDELARAIDLAERRAPQLRSLDSETAKRRLSGFLMRKGYSGGIVRVAVDRALGAASSGRGESSGPVFR